MNYALLKYRPIETNMGDYIQSLAAKRYLPNIDTLISREELNKPNSIAKIFLNGWFMHHPENWPPHNNLIPKFISFHINAHCKELLTNDEAITYYKKHEPIGCRDEHTVNLLKSKGVDAYFSGCLTLTLEKDKYIKANNSKVLFCDILHHQDDVLKKVEKNVFKKIIKTPKKIKNQYLLYKHNKKQKEEANIIIEKLIPESIINQAEYISNQNFTAKSDAEKFEIAKDLLSKFASAKLVVTSRIHVALPCLAFNTPVIFVRPDRDISRFDGITDLFNTFTLDQIKHTDKQELQDLFVKASKTIKTEHLKFQKELIKTATEFINSES